MATADGYVLPTPGVPKTLGIISVIFAVVGIFYGLCTFGSTVLTSSVMELSSEAMKQVVAEADAKKKTDLQKLDDQEKIATTETEKASIKTARDLILAQPTIDPAVAGLDDAKRMLKDPAVVVPTYINLVLGLLLAVALLVAGIGLIRLSSWGRKLALWWAGLKIAQLIVFLALQLFLTIPAQRPFQEKQMAQVNQQMKNANDPATAQAAARMVQMGQSFTLVYIFAVVVVGSIFPVVLLIMLNGAGVRAACLGRLKPEVLELF